MVLVNTGPRAHFLSDTETNWLYRGTRHLPYQELPKNWREWKSRYQLGESAPARIVNKARTTWRATTSGDRGTDANLRVHRIFKLEVTDNNDCADQSTRCSLPLRSGDFKRVQRPEPWLNYPDKLRPRPCAISLRTHSRSSTKSREINPFTRIRRRRRTRGYALIVSGGKIRPCDWFFFFCNLLCTTAFLIAVDREYRGKGTLHGRVKIFILHAWSMRITKKVNNFVFLWGYRHKPNFKETCFLYKKF